MSKKWDPRKVELVPVVIDKKKQKLLIAEVSRLLYQYICQLHLVRVKSTVNSSSKDTAFGYTKGGLAS